MDCSRPGSSVHEISQARITGVCCAKLLQSCLTLCGPMVYNPPGSSVHGILRQEYCSELLCPPPGDLSDPGVENAISYASYIHRWVLYHYRKSTGDLPNPGIKPASPALQVNPLPTVIAKTHMYHSSFLSSSVKSFRVIWEAIYQASILRKFTEKIAQLGQSTSPNYYLL